MTDPPHGPRSSAHAPVAGKRCCRADGGGGGRWQSIRPAPASDLLPDTGAPVFTSMCPTPTSPLPTRPRSAAEGDCPYPFRRRRAHRGGAPRRAVLLTRSNPSSSLPPMASPPAHAHAATPRRPPRGRGESPRREAPSNHHTQSDVDAQARLPMRTVPRPARHREAVTAGWTGPFLASPCTHVSHEGGELSGQARRPFVPVLLFGP